MSEPIEEYLEVDGLTFETIDFILKVLWDVTVYDRLVVLYSFCVLFPKFDQKPHEVSEWCDGAPEPCLV